MDLRIKRLRWLALVSVLALAVPLLVTGTGYRTNYVVLCESMIPAFHPGDLVITNPLVDEVAIGDIVVFQSPLGGFLIHRVVDVVEQDGTTFFVTKGDANAHVDSFLIPRPSIIGKLFFVVPHVGSLFLIPKGIVLVCNLGLVAAYVALTFTLPAGETDTPPKRQERPLKPLQAALIGCLLLTPFVAQSSVILVYPIDTQNMSTTSPLVILQEGTQGTATITDNIAAHISVSSLATSVNIEEYVDNDTSDVDTSADKGTHLNFTAQQHGPDSSKDLLTEQGLAVMTPGPKYAVSGSVYQLTGSPDTNYVTVGKSDRCEVTDYQSGAGTIRQMYFNITYYGTVSGTLAWAYQLDGGGWTQIEDLPKGGSASAPLTRTYNATSLMGTWTWAQLNTTDIQFQNNDAGGPENAYVDAIYVTVVVETVNYRLDLEEQWENVEYDETNEELAIYFNNGTNTHSLDATGGYMKVGNGTPNWGSTKGTISYWIRWNTIDIGWRAWGQNNNMEMWLGASGNPPTYRMVADWGNLQYVMSSTTFIPDKWYFIAITWNENDDLLILYVGDETNPPTLNAIKTNWTANVSTVGVTENNFLSSSGGLYPSDGLGDDLRYYDIDRTLDQLQSNYKTELTGAEPNLRSYFKLNTDFNDVGPNNADGAGVGSYGFSTYVPFDPSPSETLQVDVWTGSSWVTVIDTLNSGWNNVSVVSFVTTATFTIRYKDGTDTGDTSRDRWSIDATLLYVWSEGSGSGDFNYVLNMTENNDSSWTVRIDAYDQSNIARLINCSIYLYDGANSTQIVILDSEYTKQTGPWYDLAAFDTIYLWMHVEASSAGTSTIYTYLEILAPDSGVHQFYTITFEIT